jgi:hypothetical protein
MQRKSNTEYCTNSGMPTFLHLTQVSIGTQRCICLSGLTATENLYYECRHSGMSTLYPRPITYLFGHRCKRFRVHARRKFGHPLVDDLTNVAHLHKQQQAHTICHRGNIVIEGRRVVLVSTKLQTRSRSCALTLKYPVSVLLLTSLRTSSRYSCFSAFDAGSASCFLSHSSCTCQGTQHRNRFKWRKTKA